MDFQSTPLQTTPPQIQTPQEPIYQAENTRNKPLVISIILILIIAIIGGTYWYMYQAKKSNSTPLVIQMTPPLTQTVTLSTVTQPQIQSSPTIQVDKTAGWKTYTNSKYNFELKYPQTMYILEGDGDSYAAFSYKPFSDDPYVRETIFEFDTQYKERFDVLFTASIGSDVPEAHNAVGVVAKKLGNLKVDGYDAVEYTRDGTTNYDPERDGGRGGIGYEHKLIIKKDDTTYLGFTYKVENKENMDKRDEILNGIIGSIQIN